MRPDVEILREMLREAEEESVACDSRAQYCWAHDEDQRAEEWAQKCATQQARARVLSRIIEGLDPIRVDPTIRAAAPDRVRPSAEVGRILKLVE